MGLIRMAARTAVVAGTATAVSGRVAHRQNERWNQQAEAAAYEQQQYAQQAYQASYAPAAPSAPDTTSELQQLANLHAQGILTDAEFAAKKAQILGI